MISKKKAEQYLVERINKTGGLNSLLSFPRYLEIETIHKCNAKCSMCPIHNQSISRGAMSKELFEKIAEELHDYKNIIKRVSLYRDGEPLLDRTLHSKIYLLKKIGIKEVVISSNISILNSEKTKQLLDSNLDIIIMSIDSLKKNIYNKIRKGLNFDNVVQNALNFIQLRNKLNSKTKIWIRMIRQELNWNEWDEYKQFWKGHLNDSDRINYHLIHNWGGQVNIQNAKKSYQPQMPCVALWSQIVIFANGDVPMCNVDYSNSQPNGSILNQSIYDVWHSNEINNRRTLHLTGKKQLIKLCKECNAWDEPSDVKCISKDYYNDR